MKTTIEISDTILERARRLARDGHVTLRSLAEKGLKKLVTDGHIVGPMVHDARVGAICIHHGVQDLWTADRDFSRFAKIKTNNPLNLSK